MDYAALARELQEKMYLLHRGKPGKRQKKMNDAMLGGAFMIQYLYQCRGNVYPSQISDEMGISTARVAAALNNLEKKGLIARQIDTNDRRQILVTLTPEGEEAARAEREFMLRDMERLLSDLGEHDAGELVRIVGRIAEMSRDQRGPNMGQ